MSSALASQPGFASRGLSVAGLLVLALALPVFAVPACATAYADHLASAIALRVSALVSFLAPLSNDDAAASEPVADDSVYTETPSARGLTLDARHGHPTGRGPGLHAQHGVRISAAQVLALAARRAMPQAVPVKANAQHPAGLLLRGVSGLGVGMEDGDVLTEAAGQPASSVAVVVGVVLAARGRQVPEISGRFYRAGVPFGLTVEQPYPKQPLPG